MASRTTNTAVLGCLAAAILVAGCFPTFPDEGAVKDLRVLAIQQDPAVAVLDSFPFPTVTLRALVVDPLDIELGDATHTWTLELGDDFEGSELLDGLIPEGPWTDELDIDFSGLMGGTGARDDITPPDFLPATEYGAGILPLTYVVDNGTRTREAVKFLRFMTPDFENAVLPAFGPAGYRPVDVYNEAVANTPEIPEGWNANPNITKITINEGEQSFEGEQITHGLSAIDIGTIVGGEGLRFDVEVEDDKLAKDIDVELYWTHGSPGLPIAELDGGGGPGGFGGGGTGQTDCVEPKAGDPEAQDGEGFGGGAGLSERFEPDRAFGWTAPCAVNQGPMRFFLIARDGDGGVAWQELRIALE